MVPVTISGMMTNNEVNGTGVNPSSATYAVTDSYELGAAFRQRAAGIEWKVHFYD